MIRIALVIFFGFFLSFQTTSAKNLPNWELDENLVRLSPVRFLPDHPLYFAIIIKEKFDHLIKPDKAKKALFDVHLSGKKIKEAYLLTAKNNFKKSQNSLENYQKIQQRLRSELEGAQNSGLAVFDVEKMLADNLQRHLKIIVILASQDSNENFRKELIGSVEAAKNSAKLLEKDLPDATKGILDFANQIRII